MSWIEQLWRTYEANSSEVGRQSEEDRAQLLPICHSTQQAHIEITIDGDGQFIRARVVPQEDLRTIIPTTERSATRGGIKPVNHPLCDSLQYVAGDFLEFGAKVTSGYAKRPEEPFELYLNDLRAWCESPYTHPKVEAVLHYVQRRSVIRDLVSSQVLHVDEAGKLMELWDREKGDPPEIFALLKNRPQWEALVRWRVEVPGDPQSAVWSDSTLHESWIQFYISQQEKVDLCYVRGEEAKVAILHPARLRHDADSAKIISGNDTSGFTFRGRFTELSQALGVSFEVTQKAHNALRWLIRRQGAVIGDFVVVAWAVEGEEIPDPLADTSVLLDLEVAEEMSSSSFTGEDLAHRLRQRMLGYSARLGETSDIVVLALESASPGRMSIVFYRELTGSEFLARIEDWHRTCSWYHSYSRRARSGEKSGRSAGFVGAPAPVDIAEAAYGARIDEKLRKRTVERILPCIIDGQRVPRDLVENLVRRASNRGALDPAEWNKALTIACALYRKAHEKEAYSMALDERRRTRDYLYGRLLALADSLEEWALKESGEERQTNAARLMQRFAERPFSTWRIIELALAPYKARLGAKGRRRANQITEVMNLFDPEDFTDDRKLSGEFLLGFHSQKQALWNRRHDESGDPELEGDRIAESATR